MLRKLSYYLFFFLMMSNLPFILAQPKRIGINTNEPLATLDVNGKMRVGNDTTAASPAGTIRFNPDTGDFEGFDGNQWISFTPNPSDLFWPVQGGRGATASFFDASPQDVAQGDFFGHSVDIYGSYAVVGSPGWNGSQGRVFVLKRQFYFGNWEFVDTLYSTIPSSSPQLFGHSVAIYGDYIVVGSPFVSSAISSNFGSISIYKRNGNNWDFKASSASSGYCSEFGFDVDLYENTLLAGCPAPCTSCVNPSNHYGAVLIKFDQNGGFLDWQAVFKTSPPTAVSRFGHAVALAGDSEFAISSPLSNTSPREDSVHIFKRVFNAVILHQTLGWPANPEDQFGFSISMHNDKLLVGVKAADNAFPGDNKGKAALYLKSNTGSWAEHLQIAGSQDQGLLGHSVACSATHQIVAANNGLMGATAYMQSLKYNTATSTYQPYVVITDPLASMSNNQVSDVSVHGDYFIVGLGGGISGNGLQGGRVFFGKIR